MKFLGHGPSLFLVAFLWTTSCAQKPRGFAANSNAKMALDIMDIVSAEDKSKNVIMSPSSIFTGTAMLYSGTDGKTREAVRSAMGFPDDDEAFSSEIERVSTENSPAITTTDQSGGEFEGPKFVANMITVSKEADMKGPFARTIKKVFKGNPYTEDFAKNPENSRRNINLWVARRTNNKIQELMPEGSIQELTKVVLVNALYFKDNWTTAFDDQTDKAPFTLENGQKVTVDMMQGDISMGYQKFPQAQVMSVPFQSRKYQMVVVLPSGNSDLSQLLASMKAPNSPLMAAVLDPDNELRTETVLLSLPKFKSTMKIELQDTYKKMPGLRELVAQDVNLSRIARLPTKVGAINHQATIDVDTKGVESAAATAISVVLYSNFSPTETVKVDRPFAYFIVETDTGMIHVAGLMRNPLGN